MSSDEVEVHEEVAEAVQAARKEGLRDTLLGMVCPSDWTTQAPEPLGNPHTPLLSRVVPVLCTVSAIYPEHALCVQSAAVSILVPHDEKGLVCAMIVVLQIRGRGCKLSYLLLEHYSTCSYLPACT